MRCGKVTLFSVILFLHLTSSKCDTRELFGDFLKDFTEHENVLTTISILNCQPQSYSVKIARATGLPIVGNPEKLLEILKDPKVKRNDVLNIVDLDCPTARNFLSQIHPTLFGHPLRWILLVTTSTLDEQAQFLEYLPLRLDSNVILAKVTNSSSYSLAHIYKINPSSPINHEDYGGWDSKVGIIDIRPTRILSRRRSNLHHTPLTASIVITNQDTVNHLEDYKDKHIDTITKVNYRTTNILIDMLNATVKFIHRKNWGNKNKTTGKVDGMVGDMLEGRADIGGTSLFMNSERVWQIEYLTLTVTTNVAFIFRPPPLSYVANIFYLPFQGFVWLAAFFLLIFCTLTFFFIRRESRRSQELDESVGELRVTDAFMGAIGAITQQGSQIESRMLSGRIVSFFMYLSMFFLYTSYTANIVALLQSTTTSISTVKDLLESKMEVGVEDIVYNRYYFKLMTEPVRKALYDTKISPPGKKDKFMEKTKGIAKIQEGFFAFFTEVPTAFKIIEETFYENEKCGLMEIEYLQMTDPWYAIQKYSPYKEAMKVSVLKMKEFGVERREASKFYTKKPICSTQGNFDSVRLIDCYMTITIIISGFIASICVFLLEHLIKRRRFPLCEALCRI